MEIRGDYQGENNWAPGTKATLRERAESISEKWLSTLRVLYGEMRSRLRRPRTVLVSHPLNFAARLLQEKELVPHATVVLQPWLLRSTIRVPLSQPQLVRDCYPRCLKRLVYRCMDAINDKYFLPEINAFAADLGIPEEARASRLFDEWFLSPERVFLAFPEWFCPRQPDWPRSEVIRSTQFPLWSDPASTVGLPDELMAFLAEDGAPSPSPPVVITCGTANPFCSGREHFLAIAQAVHRLNGRSIVLTSEASYVPAALPPGCAHFSYLPLPSLLPHCRGCVHHGGVGTSAECLRAGVPQLVVPTQFDQFDNAELLSDYVGAALTLPASRVVDAGRLARAAGNEGGEIYHEDVVRALKRLLSPGEVSNRCRDVAVELKGRDEEGHLAPLCAGLEAMLPAGIAFDKLDFSSSMARRGIFGERAGAEGGGLERAQKVLTKLQYEMLVKRQEREQEREKGATVDVAVDDCGGEDGAADGKQRKRGGATKAIGKLVRKISNKIASSAREAAAV